MKTRFTHPRTLAALGLAGRSSRSTAGCRVTTVGGRNVAVDYAGPPSRGGPSTPPQDAPSGADLRRARTR